MLISSGVSPSIQLAPAACSVTAVLLWGAADFAGGYGSRRANAFVLTAFSHLCAFALMFGGIPHRGPFPTAPAFCGRCWQAQSEDSRYPSSIARLPPDRWASPRPSPRCSAPPFPPWSTSPWKARPATGRSPASGSQFLRSGSSLGPNLRAKATRRGIRRVSAIAALAGVGFAGFYLCIHQATGSPAWIAAISRIASFGATAIAVIVTRAPLKLDRPRVALGILRGFFDITASALFIYASQHGRLDEAVVITSLYPAVTVATGPVRTERALQPLEVCRIAGRAGGCTANCCGLTYSIFRN